ncbi:hypothetical protein EJ04DRAFT_514599 [Polyplosphaeria fusca]|uniref:Uncharacterized protein n=1 Tax=Polyplosphaeria fusca TaxID=682080 RepID=A0A9P4QUY4_9PLEO|nr:hypothetical protein EJ04DRAFT_514599 [Polyplosphaeria fusca]
MVLFSPSCLSRFRAIRCRAPSTTVFLLRRSLQLHHLPRLPLENFDRWHPFALFELYERRHPDPLASAHKILIWDQAGPNRKLIGKDVSVRDALAEYVKDGEALCPIEVPGTHKNGWKHLKENSTHLECNNYTVEHLDYGSVPIDPTTTVRWSSDPWENVKMIPLQPSTPVLYWKEALHRMYHFLKAGYPVEVSLKLDRKKILRHEKVLVQDDPEAWPWMLEHFPHLQPQFFHRAMPKGTLISVAPFSDGNSLQWIMEMPHTTEAGIKTTTFLTGHLLNLSTRYQVQFEVGLLDELPKGYKARIREIVKRAGPPPNPNLVARMSMMKLEKAAMAQARAERNASMDPLMFARRKASKKAYYRAQRWWANRREKVDRMARKQAQKDLLEEPAEQRPLSFAASLALTEPRVEVRRVSGNSGSLTLDWSTDKARDQAQQDLYVEPAKQGVAKNDVLPASTEQRVVKDARLPDRGVKDPGLLALERASDKAREQAQKDLYEERTEEQALKGAVVKDVGLPALSGLSALERASEKASEQAGHTGRRRKR